MNNCNKQISNQINNKSNSKSCSKCKEILDLENFRYRNKETDTRLSICRKCENLYRKKYYENNKAYEINRVTKYNNENREKVRKTKNIHKKNKYHTDINFKIETCIRSRFRLALKNYTKEKSTFEYLGCSILELKEWLAYNFTNEMTWENQGTLWHIDHIIPCASFNFSDEKNIYKCFHWSNLAPLESSENIKKSDKIDEKIIQYYKNRKNIFIKSKSKHNYALEPLDTKSNGKPIDGLE